MVTVAVLGGGGGQKSVDLFRRILCRNFPTALAGSRRIFCPEGPPEFLIAELPHLSHIKAPDPILLCREPFSPPGKCLLPPRAIGILSSDNTAAADFIRQAGIRALTAGMSTKDTLTLSSITPDSAVLCLQRAICDLDGQLLEPVEIPIRLSDHGDAFSILGAAATFLLSGHSHRLKQLLF